MTNFLISRIFLVSGVNSDFPSTLSPAQWSRTPKKSAKIFRNLPTIKTQCPCQLSCTIYTYDESLTWRWRWFKSVQLVAMGHKITNAPLIENLKHYFFVLGQISLWAISRDILRGPQFRGSKNSLEMTHELICQQKKIISHIFKISSTLIVIKKRKSSFCNVSYI
jgi:hypothetical protein